MPTTSRPGIRTKPSMKRRPQRDSRGRFASKKSEWDGSAWVSRAQEFEQVFESEKPHWLKRLRNWIGNRLLDAGLWVLEF